MNEYCSFCDHIAHFGACDECECPREKIPMEEWEEWLEAHNHPKTPKITGPHGMLEAKSQ